MEKINDLEKKLKDGMNPRDAKAIFARELVSLYYSEEIADKASENFVKLFKEHKIPEDIEEVALGQKTNIIDVLVISKLAKSKSESRRLIDGGGIKVDGSVIEGYDFECLPGKDGILIQKGKRHFIRIIKNNKYVRNP
jgi:tyrosyl-tRNA synthetase